MPVVVKPSASQQIAPIAMTSAAAVALALIGWVLLGMVSPSQPMLWRIVVAGVPAVLVVLVGLAAVQRVQLRGDAQGLVIVNATSTRRLAWRDVVAIDASFWGAGLLIRTSEDLQRAAAPGDSRWHDPVVNELLRLAAGKGVRVRGPLNPDEPVGSASPAA